MDLSLIETGWKIEHMEWALLPGQRLRSAGSNARIGNHGTSVPLSLARITANGVSGFGWSRITREQAEGLIGTPLKALFTSDGIISTDYRSIEFPLLDWLGRINEQPVYKLVSLSASRSANPFHVPCYDTSLYIDDLHLDNDKAAVELIQSEALEGWSRGHRNFKLKIGRGGRWMPLMEGTKRDIAIINGVRQSVGTDAKLMIDANNGYNLNLTKEVLSATAESNLYWVEEPFHEDQALYKDLKEWINQRNMPVMIADGEGGAAAGLVDWAKNGLVDVLQYDLRSYGFNRWIELGAVLDAAGVKSAPHNYG
ncbi:MAG: Mandelate racemase/muconate lactonizing protein, partial [Bacilli bacterium]|nr:Mandelate racemase/muconate lactonizing protein [Bacilli bacterium]